ncbi:TPA: cadmium-translocating P-type ATPase [Clostridioides difficile]|uniref:heavy metal translocating P-type ATPase n=1 Tax=Clostridioides difficile TaxID=1496 RepID=UPI000D1ED838|nr:heavy metal translocating P-type ATPase [Clostridioides difficile]UWD40573.1 heavy metal translocating P-type ATPase [Clostridioides difficile]UWD44358.1 heavy metal translocating P-type ATPase [Clostridioides difficile]VFC60209.1 K/Mg/Cd/Cu/Zn/Na/Ca/Na/H-transporting P-type ATPase [Clostridioides difficile]VHX86268.1 K/Mg/Cd/Cu/Zn/Na/Ca/Na/H-transporting P-type ATPase [Clostridioides difficile]VIG06720.1 K/Mg/Cd/Cu/Zn/Na/Ca/Na/H-transporting P-type ATPase [Clostridioides difficile]
MEANNLIKKEFILGGLNCAHCAEEINDKVSKLQEVKSSNLNFINKKLTVNIKESFNEDATIEKIIDIIDSTEPGLDIQINSKENASNKTSIKKELILGGLNCAHCAEEINNKVSKLKEVESSNLNFVNKKLTINISNNFEEDDIINKIKEIINSTEPGLDIQVESNDKVKERTTEKSGAVNDTNKKELIPLIIGALVYIFGIYQTATGYESQFSNIVFIVAYVIIGGDVLLRAIRNISKGRVFDENFLMSLATVGALAIGELSEAVGVMLFYKVGEYLQGVAVGKSRKSITSLMQIRPDYANLKVNSEVKVVSPEEVNVGDIIVVKPGEKVPLDGIVVDGISMLDTSALTGESVLREVEKGDEILSGVINKNALLSIEVTKSFGESTVSKILDLVENSSIKKSKTENFISKFSRYYTPIVVIAALLIAFVPPLVISGEVFSDWLYRGLIFLVVSCPCALVLSIPLSFFSGIGFASKNGILIKGSNYLEALRSVDTVVFDKTGTLTKGVFNVTKLNPEGISEEELLEYAAIAEVNSNHPIAKSILSYYNKKIDLDTIDSYEEIAAYGIRVKHNGKLILAGNEKLMKKENISYSVAKEVGTVVYIAVDKVYRGYVVISDEVKEDSKNAIRSLKAIGVKEVVMLTGDNEKVAKNIARELELDTVYSNLLPNEKVDRLEDLYEGRSEKEKIAFVGDGINDAPVLARADVGIAMGGLGSDAAIEAADVVLMTDEPSKISKAIEIANKTNKIVWQNIIFALGVKIIVMILGAGGVATMWEAIFADVGVALIAVVNAMRAMR